MHLCTILCVPLCTSTHPSAHFCTPLHTSTQLRAPLCTSMHLCTTPRTSRHLCTPLRVPPHTSMQDSDWLIVPTTSNHMPAFKNLINIKSWFFSPPPLWKTSAHLRAPLWTSAHLCTPLHTSTHLHAPLCTSAYLCAPPHTPPHTSAQDSDWLIVPTTSNHMPAFKNLINIKSWFFSPPPLWKTSAHLRAPLWTSAHLCTPPHTSMHLCAPLRTSVHLRTPLHTPLHKILIG